MKKESKTLIPTRRTRKPQDASKKPIDRGAIAGYTTWQELTSAQREAFKKRLQTQCETQTDRVSGSKTFDQFIKEVKDLLDSNATKKGYNTTGVDGPNQLYEFIHGISGDGHALGEIIYKAVRFNRKRDEVDLLKIAAWSYLIWRHGNK